MRQVFRPGFGRVLTVGIGIVCVVALIGAVARDGAAGLRAAPWLALVTGSCWAVFWRPEVAVDDAGVRLVNVFRTIELPWPAIHAVDTKWALTLITAYGRFTAWAAPAPGVKEAVSAARRDVKALPASTYGPQGIRPGDLPSSSSGGAALIIRQHWEELRDAGHLDNPQLERESAPVTWHWSTMAAGAVIVVVAGLSLLL